MNIFCLVLELFPTKQIDTPSYQLGKKFEWAANPDDNQHFKYQFIPVESVDSILRPAFVVPQYHTSYRVNRPNSIDKFYMLDCKYFDRSSEWIERPFLDPNFLISSEGAAEFINRNLRRLQHLNDHVPKHRTMKESNHSNVAKGTQHEEMDEENDEDECDDVSSTTAVSEDDN